METAEHASWRMMKQRCNNPNHDSYNYYGGRGISYTPRWEYFQNFLEDMGKKPGANYSLERRDSDLDYSRDNCMWATAKQQASNRRVGKNSPYGILGVTSRGPTFLTYVSVKGKLVQLYRGRDFFLACCARKSWEEKNSFGAHTSTCTPPTKSVI